MVSECIRLLAEVAAFAWRSFLFWAQVVGGLRPVCTGDVDQLLNTYKGSKLVRTCELDSKNVLLRGEPCSHVQTMESDTAFLWQVIGNHLSFTDSFVIYSLGYASGEVIAPTLVAFHPPHPTNSWLAYV